MENIAEKTLTRIALEHHEYIPVLEKYSLDFCCRGKRTLAEACAEKKINTDDLMVDLKKIESGKNSETDFTSMDADHLITHILLHHHFYVKNAFPVILNHLEKVVTKHGERYPNMIRILALFTAVQDELIPHMHKEEAILFPRIKEIAAAAKANGPAFDSTYISGPVSVMEIEHDKAGQLMFEIRNISNHYTAPDDACTTHRVCLDELKAFEVDLHQHVHLENNILFPMAMAMMQ